MNAVFTSSFWSGVNAGDEKRGDRIVWLKRGGSGKVYFTVPGQVKSLAVCMCLETLELGSSEVLLC